MARIEAGHGGRPILLVHGLTGGKVDFAEWLQPLAEHGWHAVAPDVRGHGQTGGPRDVEAYTPSLVCADLLALADDLGWEKFVVLGHSLGGVFVQHLALDHPERVEALILMDTAHGPVDWIPSELFDVGVALAMSDGMAALSDAIAAIAPPPSETDVQRALRERRPDLVQEDRAKFVATVPEMFAAGASLLAAGPDRLELLAQLRVDTLVLVGELDEPFIEHSRRLAHTIPDATLVILDGAGHSPQRDTPDAWWRAVSDFLA
jgi:pimeloyl-ACP methyl ester carboxylesterase